MGVALRIVRRRELAAEVLHDAFLQIWQKAASFDPQLGSGRGWIFTIVRHRALNVRRDAGSEEPKWEDFDEVDRQDRADAAGGLTEAFETGALHGCLQRLDEAKRNCILLAYVDGCTHQEIAVTPSCAAGLGESLDPARLADAQGVPVMNFANPAELNVLAGEYVLGVLPPPERAAFEQELAHNAALERAVYEWQDRHAARGADA